MPQPHPKKPIFVAFYCNKGGVGKTTLVHNLLYVFSQVYGLKTLGIDADPQCNLSNQLLKTPSPVDQEHLPADREELVDGFYENRPVNDATAANQQMDIYDCFKPLLNIEDFDERNFLDNERVKQVQLRKTKYDKLYFLPGHIDFSDISMTIAAAYTKKNSPSEAQQFVYLTKYLRKIAERGETAEAREPFDIVLIDLNPGISILNANLILGSDFFMIPAFPDSFTRQGIAALTRKLPQWVEGMSTYRTRPVESLRMPKPAQFLGYVALRYPSRKQPDDRLDVVSAYNKWWDKIHKLVEDSMLPTLRSMQVDGEPYSMVSSTFNYFRLGVKNFSSLGELVQETGVPIADVNGDLEPGAVENQKVREERQAKEHYKRKFNRIAALLLNNMGTEALESLGFVDSSDFRLTGCLFGGIKNDARVKQTIKLNFQNREIDFTVYPESTIMSEGQDNFFKLPIPYEPREIFKDLNAGIKSKNIENLVIIEMIELMLRSYENEPVSALLPRYLQTTPQANPHSAQAQAIEAVANIKRLSDRSARNQYSNHRKIIADNRAIIHGYCVQYYKRFLQERMDSPEVPGYGKFSFNLFDTFKINDATTSLIKAILLSFPVDKCYNLVIWGKKAPDVNVIQLFNFHRPSAKNTLHVRLSDDYKNFHLMVPVRNELRITPTQPFAPVNSPPVLLITDQGYWYQDNDITQVLEHELNNSERKARISATQHPLKGTGAEKTKLFHEEIKKAINHELPTLLPINIDDGSNPEMGNHWVGLYIVPNINNLMSPTMTYMDPLGNELTSDIIIESLEQLNDTREYGTKWRKINAVLVSIFNAESGFNPQITVTHLQQQSYLAPDCGPWTILNLISMHTEQRQKAKTEQDIPQLRHQHEQIINRARGHLNNSQLQQEPAIASGSNPSKKRKEPDPVDDDDDDDDDFRQHTQGTRRLTTTIYPTPGASGSNNNNNPLWKGKAPVRKFN